MLSKEVRDYIATAKGLPFFYLVGDEEYNAVLDDLVQEGLSVVRISDFCPKDDKFPSIDELVDHFRTSDIDYRDNKFVVIGLGEFLSMRGAAFAEKELRRLKNTTLGSARAVLLLRGIAQQAIRIISDDNKMIAQGRAQFANNLYTSISITNVIPTSPIVPHKGIKALLKALENGSTGRVFASTALSLDDSLLQVSRIADAYSVVKMALPSFPLVREIGSDEQWNHLLSDLSKCNSNIQGVFNKYGIDERVLDSFYIEISGLEYRNWLVFIYLKYQIDELQNSYLRLVVEETTGFEDLKRNLLIKIAEHTHQEPAFMRLYEDRKRLLRDFPEEDMAIFVKENEVDPEESIYRLTDNTMLERKKVIKWISRYGYSDAVSYVYPALADYLKYYIFDCSVLGPELTEYFAAYKKQKVTNRISDDFMHLVEQHAQSLSYAKLPTRDNAIKAIDDKENAYLYWIDALGVEYLSYISSLAKKKGLSIQTEIVRSDLPTITSINKNFFEQWTGGKKYKEGQLDNIKHKDKGGYFFTDDEDPIHIPAELEVIERAVNTAAMELGLHNCKSFVISSDHGASRLAVIRKQEVPYDTDTKGEHSGRCCKTFEGCDLPYIVEDNGYIILSDYGRFRGSRSANVEVHGGASLEEIVVPVITLTLRKNRGVQIKVMHPNDITADRHEGVTLQLYISDVDSRDKVSIIIDGQTYHGRAEDETHFVFDLKDVKRAKTKPYIAEVFDSEDLIGSVSFKVKGKTATIKDDFDFGIEF